MKWEHKAKHDPEQGLQGHRMAHDLSHDLSHDLLNLIPSSLFNSFHASLQSERERGEYGRTCSKGFDS